jgi:tetratricopeptide (TPR) repeat protein
MKRNVFYVLMLSTLSILFAVPALSQMATVKGVCKDAQGNPVTDAQVTWHNNDTGRTFKLKTNKKGEYFSLGVDPGTYNISLAKDGKELDKVTSYKVGADEVVLDFDLKKSQEEAVQQTAKAKGLTPEQIKQMQEQQAKVENYNKNIVAVNEKLKAATAAEQATPPNYDAAIASLNEAAQMVPSEDLVWFRLGGAYLDSAKIQTDPAERTKRYAEAYNDLQKAIDLKKGKAPEAGAPGAAPANGQGAPANGQAAQGNAAQGGKATAQSVSDNQKLAAYYDNFGAAASKVGKNDEAASAYKQAIELDPAHAAHYYLNLGITLMNSGGDEAKRKESAEAFDKAIAADPTNASAYYFKGQSLFAAVTTDASGKMVAPDGTTEALSKYLELQPNGSYSQSAKDMLAALGTKVETTYGTKKKK